MVAKIVEYVISKTSEIDHLCGCALFSFVYFREILSLWGSNCYFLRPLNYKWRQKAEWIATAWKRGWTCHWHKDGMRCSTWSNQDMNAGTQGSRPLPPWQRKQNGMRIEQCCWHLRHFCANVFQFKWRENILIKSFGSRLREVSSSLPFCIINRLDLQHSRSWPCPCVRIL
jgi:hypothetical protein